MTSTVKATAHCGNANEMVLQVLRVVPNAESEVVREVVIQDGESADIVVYDDLHAVSFERLKV